MLYSTTTMLHSTAWWMTIYALDFLEFCNIALWIVLLKLTDSKISSRTKENWELDLISWQTPQYCFSTYFCKSHVEWEPDSRVNILKATVRWGNFAMFFTKTLMRLQKNTNQETVLYSKIVASLSLLLFGSSPHNLYSQCFEKLG